MLEVTDTAVSHLLELYDGEKTNAMIRVAVMGSGGTPCGLGLVLDDMKETDIKVEKGDYTLVVDANLLEYCRNITIDFAEGEPDGCPSRSGRGFLLSADNPLNF